eukprot:Rhum_TRINITY_DN178_c0_g1::Rhum_TRINITY_DN178_c0_g1_i1::g.553::m.553
MQHLEEAFAEAPRDHSEGENHDEADDEAEAGRGVDQHNGAVGRRPGGQVPEGHAAAHVLVLGRFVVQACADAFDEVEAVKRNGVEKRLQQASDEEVAGRAALFLLDPPECQDGREQRDAEQHGREDVQRIVQVEVVHADDHQHQRELHVSLQQSKPELKPLVQRDNVQASSDLVEDVAAEVLHHHKREKQIGDLSNGRDDDAQSLFGDREGEHEPHACGEQQTADSEHYQLDGVLVCNGIEGEVAQKARAAEGQHPQKGVVAVAWVSGDRDDGAQEHHKQFNARDHNEELVCPRPRTLSNLGVTLLDVYCASDNPLRRLTDGILDARKAGRCALHH